MKQLQLGINYELIDNHLVLLWAKEAMDNGEYTNFDHAYESMWNLLEQERTCEHACSSGY